MSGTSADGVDVAVCELGADPAGPWGRLLQHRARPYPRLLQARIWRLRMEAVVALGELADVTRQLTLEHAVAVREAIGAAGLTAEDVTAVADHGQTVFHAPPLTMQLLDASLLAAEVGVGVVSDFRHADLAAGGQGAPLVPLADRRLFAHPTRTRILLNLGGIANVTVLRAGDAPLAFDTGPANCLSDYICRTLAPETGGVDMGGERAQRGRVDVGVVTRFLAEPFVAAPPPKSTDGPAMVAAFERACGGFGGWRVEDLLATAAACVGASVGHAVRTWGMGRSSGGGVDLVLSGGGVHNAAIVERLGEACPGAVLLRSDELGVPSAAREAIAFALLGLATLQGRAGNVPSATGAGSAVVLGSWTPPPEPAE